MDDATAAASLSAVDRSRIKPTLTGIEVRSAFDEAEFAALTEARQQMALSWASAETFDSATDGPDDKIIKFLFGAASVTRSNLGAARTENISRGDEIGFGSVVKESDVAFARTL